MNPIKKMFDISALLPSSGALGEVPSTRQAYKDVVDIALPSVTEMVLMSLIMSIDTMLVGKTVSSTGIAAIGLVAQPRMLLLCFFFALNTGVTAIVARRKGENRQEEANRTLRNALAIILGLALLLMTLGLLFSRQLMLFAGAQADTVEVAETYFRILAWMLPVNGITMCVCAAQRGVGNTRIAMFVNIVSNLTNVVFSYLLIGGNFGFPRLEVAGAAYAAAIGMGVGFVLSLVTLFETKHAKAPQFLHLRLSDDWRLDKETVLSIIKLGGNAMLEQVALRIGFFSYAKIVAGLGTEAFAAHHISMQFLNISFTFGDGIGIAGTSLVGQMLGKKRPDLAHVYGKASQRMALVVSLVLASIIVVFRHPLVSLFADPSEAGDVLDLAANVLIIVALFQPFQTTAVVISGALRGAGDNRFVAGIMMLCVAIIRPTVSLLSIWALREVFGRADIALMGAWAASLVDMIIRMVCVYKRFNGGKWHDIRV